MIRLAKGPKPQVLQQNDAAWTAEYVAHIQAGQSPPDTVKGRYRHPEIRSSVEAETARKCAYCETYIKAASFGDVEHILPKAKHPHLVLDWTNLTLACEICNRQYKREHDDPPLIHPYNDTPSAHLQPEGPLVLPVPNDRKGKTTETVLQLNREELLLKRAERIKALIPLLDQWEAEANPAFKAILKRQLEIEAANDREYSFVICEFLKRRGALP